MGIITIGVINRYFIVIFYRDTDFILRQRELQDVIFFSKKHTTSDTSERARLFSQLSKSMVQKLYEKYKVDFEMFDYGIDDYLEFDFKMES